jgi:serine/threonine-protein kinase
VIGQTPRGGTSVEVDSQVTITVGTGPSTVKVPDLYGNTPDQAAGILEEIDLQLGEQTEAPSDKVAEGQIIEQQPTAGAAVEPGSKVSVTVSSGPELRTVPNVVGQSAEQAKAELWNAYFASTVVTVPSDEPEGTVVSTDPPAGTRADWRAITVTVNVSAGPPETTAPARRGDGNGGAENRSGPGGGGNGPGGGGKEGKGGDNGDRGKGNNN